MSINIKNINNIAAGLNKGRRIGVETNGQSKFYSVKKRWFSGWRRPTASTTMDLETIIAKVNGYVKTHPITTAQKDLLENGIKSRKERLQGRLSSWWRKLFMSKRTVIKIKAAIAKLDKFKIEIPIPKTKAQRHPSGKNHHPIPAVPIALPQLKPVNQHPAAEEPKPDLQPEKMDIDQILFDIDHRFDNPIPPQAPLPIALIFYPKMKDLAFNLDDPHARRRIEHLSTYCNVYTFEVNSLTEAKQCTQHVLGEVGKCQYMEFAGHGDPGQFMFDRNPTNPDGHFGLHSSNKVQQTFKDLLGSVGANGIIVTQSCENGVEIPGKTNILQRIAQFALPGQRVCGATGKLIDFEYFGDHPGHFDYRDRNTNRNVTQSYQKTMGGNVQKIPIEEVKLLSRILGNTVMTMELAYQIYAALDSQKHFRDLIGQHPTLPEKLKEFFHALTISKEPGTIWGEMLQDLESFALRMRWYGKKTLSLLPQERGSRVDENNETLTIREFRKKTPYETAYHFILSLSAMERFSDAIVTLDNGRRYSENLAAKALYALTGSPLHSHQVQAKTILSGHTSVLDCAKQSYRLAKEKRKLEEWFQQGFGGVCLDGYCDTLLEYYEEELSGLKEDQAILALEKGDSLQDIVTKCANFYTKKVLKDLNLKQTPVLNIDPEYEKYILAMTIENFIKFVAKEINSSKLNKGLNTGSLLPIINNIGVFWCRSELQAELAKINRY